MQVHGGCQGFLIGDFQDRAILDNMYDLVWPKERNPDIIILMSLLKVCQEWVILHGDVWRMLRVFYQTPGGQGQLDVQDDLV